MKKSIKIIIATIIIAIIIITTYIFNYNKAFIFLALNKDTIEIYGRDIILDETDTIITTNVFKVDNEDKNKLLEIYSRSNYTHPLINQDILGTNYSFALVDTKTGKEMIFTTSGTMLTADNKIFHLKDEGLYKEVYEIYLKYRPQGPKH